MEIIKNFLRIVNVQTLVVIVLAFVSTYFCFTFGFYADLPTGLIGIAIIFPIVFSINAAYRRREEALKYFASLKAHLIALYYAHRDWVPENSDHKIRLKQIIMDLLSGIDKYFTSPSEKEKLKNIYIQFSNFSKSHELLRKGNTTNSEISRANQYLRSMLIEFEKMKNILQYRTPVALRAYSQIFLNIFPILYAPYFAFLSKESYTVVGFGVAFIYSIVLVSLDNIQEDLENPFDKIGMDDIRLDVIDEVFAALED